MMTKNPYPILEFDDNKTAKLNPSVFVSHPFDTDKMVITFFPEVVDALIAEEKIKLDCTIGGENPVYVYRFTDTDVLITLGAIGCPACGGNLDLFHAMGITKVMFCGGGDVKSEGDIKVSELNADKVICQSITDCYRLHANTVECAGDVTSAHLHCDQITYRHA